MKNPQKENGYTPIANEILEALSKININSEARRMLDVIIRKTYGFRKKHDLIATSQFMQLTGMNRKAVHRGRRRLLDMNLISVDKTGDSQVIGYSFQKDYDKWKVRTNKGTVDKMKTRCGQNEDRVYPKLGLNSTRDCHPQKKERKYTKESIQKKSTTVSTSSYFYERFKETFGREYIANFGKDGKIFKDLLTKIPMEDLKKLIDLYLTTPDKFVSDGGYSVGIFKSRINSLRMGKATSMFSDKALKSGLALKSWIDKGEDEE